MRISIKQNKHKIISGNRKAINGVGVGLYTYDDADGYFNIGLGGQIGIEYNLNTHDIPLMVSLDARPMWDFLGSNAGFGWGAALGIRYTW